MKKVSCGIALCAALCALSVGTASAEGVSDYLKDATHKVYLGHCDQGKVQITSYKLANGIRLEEYAMTHRQEGRVVPKLYTVEIPNELRSSLEDPPARFFIVNASGKEHEYRGSEVYVDLQKAAPNLYNKLRTITGFGLSASGVLQRNRKGAQFPNDCELNNKDETGPWEPISGT